MTTRRFFIALNIVTLSLMVLVLGHSLTAQDDHSHTTAGEARAELSGQSPIALNPGGGAEIGFIYEAFLSPHQEGGEEEDTPAFIPAQFRSTAPSVPRDERTGRGHAVLQFTKDLSRAQVFFAVENIDPATVVMLHLHCGRPGQLGPIIVDFGLAGNVPTYLADGTMSLDITNHDITAVTADISGPVEAFTRGCPITTVIPNEKVRTIAGMQIIAQQGEIYFNLHTAGQVYFGDIRGQFYPVMTPTMP